MVKRIGCKKRRGEGYIDTVVEVLVFTMLLVLALNVFGFLKLKMDMDHFAKEMVTAAAVSGNTSSGIVTRYVELTDETGIHPYCYWDADYFDAGSKVQYGDTITLTLKYDTTFQGFGVFNAPITLTVKQSALSQKYWKGTG